MHTNTTSFRNPFGVQDAPDPEGRDIDEFAAGVDPIAEAADAIAWGSRASETPSSIEGAWSSRWNGGADPTIPGDANALWKQGHATVRSVGDRVYLLFDWGQCRRRALIDARHDGAGRLVGRYINLGNPEITQPWVGVIVDHRRIDGRWPNGRLDFRR